MPGSTVSVFSEPDDYQMALRADAEVDFLVVGRGAFRAQLTRIALNRVHLLAGEETLSRIAFIRPNARLVRVSLPGRNGDSLFWDGVPSHRGEIVTHGPGQPIHERTDGPSRWRTIWLPAKELAGHGRAMIGARFDVPHRACRWRPAAGALRCLTDLHDAAIRANRLRPRVAAAASAARGLEQQVIEAVVECLSMRTDDEGAPARFRHASLMSRFEDVLQTHPDRPISSDTICATLDVPGRTLRACCEARLGMGPQRYLRLRRLRLAYRALRDADARVARVSDVARRCGFSGLGRFAAAYREQFGELPSDTLARDTEG
jgi:AraC-like DNA-binding protein